MPESLFLLLFAQMQADARGQRANVLSHAVDGAWQGRMDGDDRKKVMRCH